MLCYVISTVWNHYSKDRSGLEYVWHFWLFRIEMYVVESTINSENLLKTTVLYGTVVRIGDENFKHLNTYVLYVHRYINYVEPRRTFFQKNAADSNIRTCTEFCSIE